MVRERQESPGKGNDSSPARHIIRRNAKRNDIKITITER
jgi:hypothetical protein